MKWLSSFSKIFGRKLEQTENEIKKIKLTLFICRVQKFRRSMGGCLQKLRKLSVSQYHSTEQLVRGHFRNIWKFAMFLENSGAAYLSSAKFLLSHRRGITKRCRKLFVGQKKSWADTFCFSESFHYRKTLWNRISRFVFKTFC